ncbi:MAG TPA: substrate-binding domain-containing protein, partial [Deinococcales bacterium]|nr:substrate-binding domain-containing protein [Deinococcales bacterium]
LGHRRIATIAGPPARTTGRERLDGFLSAMASAGLSVPERYVRQGGFQEEPAGQAMAALLEMPDAPTAVFVANNSMMAGAFAAIRERAARVPGDLSIVSFDDVQWARYVDPPLTVVAQAADLIGSWAAELAFRRLSGEDTPVRRVLDPVLIVRGSTAAPRA